MALDPIFLLVNSLLDLMRGSFFVAIPVFLLVIAGRFLRVKISEKTGWKWIGAAFAATFAILWLILLLAYFFPAITALQESNIGETPSIFAPSAGDIMLSYLYGLFKVTATAVVASFLLMPFEFIGLFIFESLAKNTPKLPDIAYLAITVYLACVVSAAVIIFLVPETINGVVYFFYFG